MKSDCTPNDPSQAKLWICTPQKQCVRICLKQSDCASGELCEDSQCRQPACAVDSECGGNEQICNSGACRQPPSLSDVATCAVVPSHAVLHTDVMENFRIIARNSLGEPMHVVSTSSEVSWNAGSQGLALDPANHLNAVVTGSATSGVAQLTASIGNLNCTGATVTNYALAPAGKLRVVVADSDSHSVLSDASVTVNDEQAESTDGTLLFDAPETPSTITVTHSGYQSVRFVEVTSTDVIAYVKPKLTPVKLSGRMTARSFDKLQDFKGTVHASIAGSAIHGSLNELDLSTLFGELIETTIDLGGSNTFTTGIPEGASIGLAENMYKGNFAVNVDPGLRTLWSFGGNAVLSDVLGVVQAKSDMEVDKGAILGALLPVFGRLQAGALPFRSVPEPASLEGFAPQTLLRLQTKVTTPDLVPYQLHCESTRPDSVIVIGGVHEQTQGFVPVGFSAGIDHDQNGKVDPVFSNTAGEGAVALRMAPSSNGLEESPTEVVALVGRLDSLFSSDPAVPRVLSAAISRPGPILFKNNATNSVATPSTLSVPDEVRLSGTSFTQSGVSGATLHRLDVGDWSIYFPASAQTVDLTGVPMSEKVSLHSIRLGLKAGVDYQSILRFDGDDIDDLSDVMDAFSIRSLTSQDITQ